MKNFDFDAIIKFIKDILPILSTVISTIISWKVAKHQSRTEIEKFIMSYTHDDEVEMRNTFSDMIYSLSQFQQFGYQNMKDDARKQISKFITLSPLEFHETLNELFVALDNGNPFSIKPYMQKLNTIYSVHLQKHGESSAKKQKNLIK